MRRCLKWGWGRLILIFFFFLIDCGDYVLVYELRIRLLEFFGKDIYFLLSEKYERKKLFLLFFFFGNIVLDVVV